MSTTLSPAKTFEQPYLAAFAARRRERAGASGAGAIRDAAIERFATLGFPTTHDENWKYTNILPFLKNGFESTVPIPVGSVAERLRATPFFELGCPRAVFVNGRFEPALSSLPGGVTVGSLRDALANGAAKGHLARYAAFEDNAMVALNTALFEDGAFVEIANGAVLEAPLQLVFAAAGSGGAVYPRNLIVAGRDSQAEIVETYLGRGEGASFTNAVTELAAGDGAVIGHYKIQAEAEGAVHFGALAIRQGSSSNVVSHNVALGAVLARNEITAVLDGDGANCTLNGLYVLSGRRHVDNYTTLDHARPHGTSHELYKGILDGKSQGVFHGRIIVRPDAQKTDAIQRNKNLLLSGDAVINTKPQLEIYADDVKCTHGATVGQVDEEAVFYLRSRGVPLEQARALLTFAFTADVISQIKVEAIRARLREALFTQLAGTENGSV